MGQCFGMLGRRRLAQRSNKRFEYTPKRSWMYRDDHVMSQFASLSQEGGASSEEEPDDDEEGRVVMVESDEEIDTGSIRESGRLVFHEQRNEKIKGTAIVNTAFEDPDSPGELRPTVGLLPPSSSNDEELTLVSHSAVT